MQFPPTFLRWWFRVQLSRFGVRRRDPEFEDDTSGGSAQKSRTSPARVPRGYDVGSTPGS